ncbi:hypothetical protein [Reyranella sp.]|uniref:hypothetical protein n=1 Tax=Reyranella sp. TaxID=1929291 RepID=UPI003BABC6D5
MPGLVIVAPRGARLEDVAEAVAAGCPLRRRADPRQVAFDHIDQAVDRRTVVARRLDLHPAADAGQNLLAVEGRDVGTRLAHACLL